MKKRDFRSHKNHSEMGEAEPTGDEEDRALLAPPTSSWRTWIRDLAHTMLLLIPSFCGEIHRSD